MNMTEAVAPDAAWRRLRLWIAVALCMWGLAGLSGHGSARFFSVCETEQSKFERAKKTGDAAEIARIRREVAGNQIDCPALRRSVRAYGGQLQRAREARTEQQEQTRANADWDAGRAAFQSAQYATALPLLDVSCRRGFAQACRMGGDLYYHGSGTAADRVSAHAHYQQACDLGDYQGCDSLAGMIYLNSTPGADLAPIISIYRNACDHKYLNACDHLAALYFKRDGGESDRKLARDLYQQACDGGYAKSCVTLASVYERGDKVEQNTELAAGLYEKGCNGGQPMACSYLAGLLQRGAKGVGKDPARAAQLYDKACTAKEVEACVVLGFRFADDRARATDYATRAKAIDPTNVRVKALLKRLRMASS